MQKKVVEKLEPYSLNHVRTPITDFGKHLWSAPSFYEVYPKSGEDICAIMKISLEYKISLRFRGNGHSMNGFSLPDKSDLLIRNSLLNHYRFEEKGTVTAGSGIAPWDLNQFLKSKGYKLFACSDGGESAPTLAGYISAGGICGNETSRSCAFWETVLEIVFVSPSGDIIQCTRDDPLFPWIFGSMGQLGFILEIKLQIVEDSEFQPAYPQGIEGVLEKSPDRWDKINLYWFSLFSSTQQETEALKRLNSFIEKVKSRSDIFWESMDIYHYSYKYENFNPPLVYPYQGDFVVNGLWGTIKNPISDYSIISNIEKEFHNFVISNQGYRRYIQTEVVHRGLDYREYFGHEIFDHFFNLKKKYDPCFLLNHPTIFGGL